MFIEKSNLSNRSVLLLISVHFNIDHIDSLDIDQSSSTTKSFEWSFHLKMDRWFRNHSTFFLPLVQYERTYRTWQGMEGSGASSKTDIFCDNRLPSLTSSIGRMCMSGLAGRTRGPFGPWENASYSGSNHNVHSHFHEASRASWDLIPSRQQLGFFPPQPV